MDKKEYNLKDILKLNSQLEFIPEHKLAMVKKSFRNGQEIVIDDCYIYTVPGGVCAVVEDYSEPDYELTHEKINFLLSSLFQFDDFLNKHQHTERVADEATFDSLRKYTQGVEYEIELENYKIHIITGTGNIVRERVFYAVTEK